jgi:hypothetical protein
MHVLVHACHHRFAWLLNLAASFHHCRAVLPDLNSCSSACTCWCAPTCHHRRALLLNLTQKTCSLVCTCWGGPCCHRCCALLVKPTRLEKQSPAALPQDEGASVALGWASARATGYVPRACAMWYGLRADIALLLLWRQTCLSGYPLSRLHSSAARQQRCKHLILFRRLAAQAANLFQAPCTWLCWCPVYASVAIDRFLSCHRLRC